MVRIDDINSVQTVDLFVRYSILGAFSALAENTFSHTYGGFWDPTDVFNGFPDVMKRLRDSVEAGKQVVQIMSTGGKHFVLLHLQPVGRKVTILDTLGLHATKRPNSHDYSCQCRKD